jgi:hypothetical protein
MFLELVNGVQMQGGGFIVSVLFTPYTCFRFHAQVGLAVRYLSARYFESAIFYQWESQFGPSRDWLIE